MPQWYLDEPHLYPGDAFYLKAFFDLSTCRQMGMGLGPIPWDKILMYAKFNGLDEDVTEAFIVIIRELDIAFIEQVNKEKSKDTKPPKSK